MGKKKEISLSTRKLIVDAVERGDSYSQVALNFSVSRASVANFIKLNRQGDNLTVKKRSGRPKKTSQSDDRVLIRLSKADPRKSAVSLNAEIRLNYNIQMSVTTTKERLRHANLFGRRPVKKPMVSLKNRIAREAFAKDHLN